MNIRAKIANWFSDRRDDLDFLRRRDISLRFKILNILSGDRLRAYLAFAGCAIHDVKRYYDQIAELKSDFGEDLTLADYDGWVRNVIGWHIDKAVRHHDDIWQI